MVILLRSSSISRHELRKTGPNSVKVSENNNAAPNSSIRGDWNYQIGIWISMVYTKEACVEKKKGTMKPTEPQIPHMLYFHFLVKPRSCSFLMYTQGINNFDTVNVKKN